MVESIKTLSKRLEAEVSKIIVGKDQQIRLMVMSVLCGGHVLIDDLPGVGKTTLVKTMAKALGIDFSRVQFTPDLLPSDILGMNIFNQKTGDFAMMHGPVMTNIFLADEINRAIPRTQSALLEAMEELQVTVDGKTYPLPMPFLVLATQNPVEMESTFHLPIAQMDRFMIRISLGYPGYDEEIEMLKIVGDDIDFGRVEAVTNGEEIMRLRKDAAKVHIADTVMSYIVSIVSATRESEDLKLPVGPRGSRALYRAGKVWAAMDGREFVTPDDIRYLAMHVLPHRVSLSNAARRDGKSEGDVIGEVLDKVTAPPSKEDILNA